MRRSIILFLSILCTLQFCHCFSTNRFTEIKAWESLREIEPPPLHESDEDFPPALHAKRLASAFRPRPGKRSNLEELRDLVSRELETLSNLEKENDNFARQETLPPQFQYYWRQGKRAEKPRYIGIRMGK
uniref:Uncharacterized protein n=1 Tax=Clytia hemisphaerica TaxID=252671 RepID=A0A7M5WTJ8_9CNID